jgi:hypothetical protein
MCCRTAAGGQAVGHLGNRGPLTGHRQNGRAASDPLRQGGLLGRLLAVGDKQEPLEGSELPDPQEAARLLLKRM